MYFPCCTRFFFLLWGQKMDLFAQHGAIKSTLWPASRKNLFDFRQKVIWFKQFFIWFKDTLFESNKCYSILKLPQKFWTVYSCLAANMDANIQCNKRTCSERGRKCPTDQSISRNRPQTGAIKSAILDKNPKN